MRLRDLGISIGLLPTGPLNAITDVAGVRVGHTTLIDGDGPRRSAGPIRTGVTVIVPHDGRPVARARLRGRHRLNGNGELTGLEWIREAACSAGRSRITNTHSVGVVRDAIIAAAIPRPRARRVLGPAGRRRDVGRLAQRHRPPGDVTRGAPLRGAGLRRGGPGRRGQRRRRHRHDLPRVQGRDRHRVAARRDRARRLHRGRPGAGELRRARATGDRRRSDRAADHHRRGTECRGPRRPTSRRGFDHRRSWRPMRRSCPTSASGWRSAPAWASRAPAAPADTAAAISSWRLPPAITFCRPNETRHRSPTQVLALDDGHITRCSGRPSRRPRRPSRTRWSPPKRWSDARAARHTRCHMTGFATVWAAERGALGSSS